MHVKYKKAFTEYKPDIQLALLKCIPLSLSVVAECKVACNLNRNIWAFELICVSKEITSLILSEALKTFEENTDVKNNLLTF